MFVEPGSEINFNYVYAFIVIKIFTGLENLAYMLISSNYYCFLIMFIQHCQDWTIINIGLL